MTTCQIKKPGQRWVDCSHHHLDAAKAYDAYRTRSMSRFTTDDMEETRAFVSVPHPRGGNFEAIFIQSDNLNDINEGVPFTYDEVWRDRAGNIIPGYGLKDVKVKYYVRGMEMEREPEYPEGAIVQGRFSGRRRSRSKRRSRSRRNRYGRM